MTVGSSRSKSKQRKKKKSAGQRGSASAPSKQIITRSNGRKQTIYHDADGKLISKARYDKLLRKTLAVKKPRTTRQKRGVSKAQMATDTKTAKRKQHKKQKSAVQQNAPSDPSKQISTRSDGRKQTIHRDANGKVLPKAQHDKLLRKKRVAQKPPTTRHRHIVGKDQEVIEAQVTTHNQLTKNGRAIQRDSVTGPSKQIITRSDGRNQTIYRDADGEFISKAKYDELLRKESADQKQPATRKEHVVSAAQQVADTKVTTSTVSQAISGSGTTVSASKGSAALGSIQAGGDVRGVRVGNDTFPIFAPSQDTIVVDQQRKPDVGLSEKATSISNNSEPQLGDFVKDILKDELPLLHEFLKINVDRLKGRAQADTSTDASFAKGNPSTASARTSATVDNGGTAVGNLSVDGNVAAPVNIGTTMAHYYSPPDPEKEIKEELRKASGKAILRPDIEKLAKEAHASGRRPALNGYTLSGCHLEKIDLSDADLIEASLDQCNLTGAVLQNADLRRANLTRADLTGAILAGANCSEAIFNSAVMQDIDLRGAKLRKAKFIGAKLDKANLEKSDLSESDLSEATLKDVHLQGALFDSITITDKSDLDPQSRAVIEVASWEDPDPVILKDVSFKGVILRGARLVGYDLAKSDFTKSDLTNADFRHANLQDAKFTQANLDNAKLSDAELQRADLHNAYLGRASLRRTQLSNANLANADLRAADLLTADLKNAVLVQANFQGAKLIAADLRDADFSGANFRDANLRSALVDVKQLEATARSLSGAIMPDGSKHP